MKRLLPFCAAVILLAAGCATPDARIKKNPDVFNALPADVQENVRKGRIDIGYSKDAVSLALGRPNREYTRRTADRMIEVWAYTAEYVTYERQRADSRIRVYDDQGRRRTITDWVWVDVERRHEYDRLRVEFTDAIVTAIENTER